MTHDKVPSALFRRVSSVAFSPDGKYAVSGSWDGTVSIWEVISGKELFRMTHDFEVNSVNFSPDGKYIVSGGADRTARVWEVASGKEVARMTHDDHVITAIFSPDSSYVVSASWDDTARAWEYFPEDLIITACSYALRNLTHTEWNTFIGDALPYQAVCTNLPIEADPTPTP
jgi:WD40 repeat protein